MRNFCFIVLFVILGCKNTTKNENVDNYHSDGRFIVKETYRNDRLISRKYYNSDTIAHGAEIEYHPNGNIAKWKWFDSENKYAYCAVYYDGKSEFIGFKGCPFIRAAKTVDNKTAIEMVRPPHVPVLMGYKDIFRGEVVRKSAFEPGLTDTTCWVTLNDHEFRKGHEYKLFYYFMNDNNKIADSASTELLE